MLKAAIVDDEAVIVEGLLSAVEWEAYGFEIVYSTTKPTEMLAYLDRNPLDLLVTDVSMPEVNGIELLRHAKKRNPAVSILVVSAYDRFDYVRTALREGAENYLLKPIDVEELSESLSQIASHLQDRQESFREPREYQIPTFRSNLTERWVKNTISYDELLEKSAVMGIDLSASNYTVVLFRLKHTAESRMEESAHRLYDTVLHCAARKLYGQFYFETANTLVCVLSQSSGCTPADFASNVCGELRRQGDSCFAVISPTVPACTEVHQCYAKAHSLLFMAWSKEPVLRCDNPPLTAAQLAPLRKMAKLGQDLQFEEAALLCGSLFQKADSGLPAKRLAILLCAALLEGAGTAASSLLADAAVQQLLEAFPTRGEAVEYSSWTASFLNLCSQSRDGLQKVLHPYVSAAIRKIQDFSDVDLSVKTVAAQMGISPAYLGHLFRQQTGVYFNDYLTNIRLEHAERLISTTNLKINEIVEKTGFASQTYFNRIFKRTFGVSPLAYRRKKKVAQLS